MTHYDDIDDGPEAPARNGWEALPPPPRRGDQYTDARTIINSARLVLPVQVKDRPDLMDETCQERRVILADFLREHGVPVPDFVPTLYGWLDCYTGLLANPADEPGANGRRYA